MSTTSPDTRRVLVAVDGSPASLEALRAGHQMATLRLAIVPPRRSSADLNTSGGIR